MDWTDVVRTESLNKVKEMIKTKGLPIDSTWMDYEALNASIVSERKDVAKYLLGKNCRVNKITQPLGDVNTPLHNAVLLGDIELVSELLKKGALVQRVNSSGNTPLHIAFIDKQNDITNVILTFAQRNPNFTNLKNKQGLSHMHIACTTKNSKVIENFIEAGVNIEDFVNNGSLVWPGYTVLHFAAAFKSHEAVKLLLKAGANPKTKNADQQTPGQLANESLIDSAVIVDALSIVKGNPWEPEPCVENVSYFHMACLRNDHVSVKKFIDKGAEINACIASSSFFSPHCTPLHFAVMANQEKNVKRLLMHDANVDCPDYNDMTPVHHAMYNKNRDPKSALVDFLHDEVYDKLAEFEDRNGLGYFHVAIMRNDLVVVKDFLDDGQNVNWPLAEHTPKFPAYYPLHFAARYERVKMAALLMKRGADVNKVSWHGTPLHIAFELGNLDLIKLFFNNGANVKLLRSKDKKTMLHLLVESYVDQKDKSNSKADVLLGYIKKLIMRGVDVNAQTEILNDDDSDTALHFACNRIRLGSPCVKLLLDSGADINLKNTQGFSPLPIIPSEGCSYDNDYRGNAADFMMLYHHVQKLKALGLYVDPKNEDYCKRLMKRKNNWDPNAEEFQDETIERLEQERLAEIKILKSIKLTKSTTLHDFLLLDAKSVVGYANNNILKKVAESKNLERDYSSYGYLILLQYEKALAGTKVEGTMKRAINNTTPENSSKRLRRE